METKVDFNKALNQMLEIVAEKEKEITLLKIQLAAAYSETEKEEENIDNTVQTS